MRLVIGNGIYIIKNKVKGGSAPITINDAVLLTNNLGVVLLVNNKYLKLSKK